jgi:hypothetical protein
MSKQYDTLFISPVFFGYAQEIKKALEARGRCVAYFENRPAQDSLTKAIIRIAPLLVAQKSARYFQSIIAQLSGHPIKHVFVIKGEALSPASVRRMRQAFPGAFFTLYFWDSYRNMPADSREKAALFDRVLTFDPHDAAENPGMIYRPLFFLQDYVHLAAAVPDIDVFFLGTAHSDRYAILKKIERELPSARFEKCLYFPAKWLYYANCLRYWDLPAERGNVTFVPKTKAEIRALVARSRIVVDIERSVQSGFTIRTLEMLGAGKKQITTNAAVRQADFYDPQNILVVDRSAPKIPTAFLETPYVPPAEEIVRRYSLDCWLDEVVPQSR